MKSTNKEPRKKIATVTSVVTDDQIDSSEETLPVDNQDSARKHAADVGSEKGGGNAVLQERAALPVSPTLTSSDISEPEAYDEQQKHFTLTLPTREQFLAWAPFLGVILLGAILRFWGLGDKPLHHDESLHAYFSLNLLHTTIDNWMGCVKGTVVGCYRYDPLLHGPFQFHMIATVYRISQWLGAPDNGVNTTTVRIGAATLGTVIIGLPFFLRDYLGKFGAWLACFLLAVSPSMVYFSRFAREDIYMACFTLLMVVAVGRYVHTRKGYWLFIAAIGFMLSYATKEATFLSIGIFGTFFFLVVIWDLGVRFPVRSRLKWDATSARYVPKTAAPIAVCVVLLVLAPLAKLFFNQLKNLSIYVTDPRNTNQANAFVQNLKDKTIAIFPWLGILLGIFVLVLLVLELVRKEPAPGRRGLAKYVDPKKQPLLDTIVTMAWTHWFFALIGATVVFVVLYTALFTNLPSGIGDGVWQGLYYWLQQQQVARGSQPWYYYFMLIPLYEQIGLVFGIAGVIRCLIHPSRFRLFLVFWFVGNVFIYSWAGEKMPWLMIHMTMPMLLLAAIGLEPLALRLFNLAKEWRNSAPSASVRVASTKARSQSGRPAPAWLANGGALIGGLVAVFLLVLTLQNMYQVSYVHAADGPHEMMIYVQTTVDVNTVMAKIDALDKQKFGGKHLMPIGVNADDPEWPFHWYLRDYTNVCFTYPTGCATLNPAVILYGGKNLYSFPTEYATSTNGQPAAYLAHQYHLRTWWDEGYKPVPCVPTKTDNCADQPTWGGVGPFLWLSYGDTPPPGASFNLGLAVTNVWQWWWQRKAIGSTGGATDMGFMVRRDLGMQP